MSSGRGSGTVNCWSWTGSRRFCAKRTWKSSCSASGCCWSTEQPSSFLIWTRHSCTAAATGSMSSKTERPITGCIRRSTEKSCMRSWAGNAAAAGSSKPGSTTGPRSSCGCRAWCFPRCRLWISRSAAERLPFYGMRITARRCVCGTAFWADSVGWGVRFV